MVESILSFTVAKRGCPNCDLDHREMIFERKVGEL
jgi:hypothetical protein